MPSRRVAWLALGTRVPSRSGSCGRKWILNIQDATRTDDEIQGSRPRSPCSSSDRMADGPVSLLYRGSCHPWQSGSRRSAWDGPQVPGL